MNAEFRVRAFPLVITKQTFSDLVRRHANDCIFGRVVSGSTPEDFHSQNSLLQFIEVSAKGLFDDVSKKFLTSPASLKTAACEDLIQMSADSLGAIGKLTDFRNRSLMSNLGGHSSIP